MNLFNAFRKEWLESLRNYRLLIVVIALVFFGITSPLFAKLTPEIVTFAVPKGVDISQIIPTPSVSDAILQYVKNVSMVCLILAVLITMGAVAQEKDKGTAAMMLVKPFPRGSFISAKFLGLAATFALAILIAGIGAYYYTLILFKAMDILYWLILNLFLFLYTMCIVAITLLCSTITKSQAAAGGMALGIVVIGWIIGIFRNFATYLPGELATWGKRLLAGETVASWPALGITVVLIVLPLLAAWLIFRRQEL